MENVKKRRGERKMRLQDKLVPYLEYCTYRKELVQKTVKAYRIDLSSVWFWSPVKSKTKRSLRNILRNYIKNTNRTEIKKSGYFVGNGRGNGKKYFYENRFPFRCI